MFFTTFSQMLALALLILVGIYIGKKGMFDSHTMAQLSKTINYIFNPMLIITSALSGSQLSDKSSWYMVFAIAIVFFLIMILVSFAAAPLLDKDKDQQHMYQLMLVFSNLGFMGIPVVKGVYGDAYTIYVMAFMMTYNIYFYTFGVTLLEGKFNAGKLKGMINPGTISGIIALLIFICDIQLPAFLTTSIDYLGSIASPLAMIAVGVTVSNADLKAIFTNGKLYIFTLLKMIALPLVLIPVLRLLPLSPSLIGVCLLELAMPVGNLNLIIGTEKGIDCTNTSAAIIMTTLLSVFTLPVLALFL